MFFFGLKRHKMYSKVMFSSSHVSPFGEYILLVLFTFGFFALTNAQGPMIHVNAIRNGTAFLPCDIRPPIRGDSSTLVLWYKETEENPIYSFDNRGRMSESGSHWKDNSIFGGRAFFRTVSSPTGLSLDNVQESDAGHYRCRVDYFQSPTKNHKLYLNVIVPPNEPSIFDENGNNLTQGFTRPYEEGATMTLTCVAKGGRPKPQLQWWREGMLLESTNLLSDHNVSSSITVTNMNRSYFQTMYSCQAVNNNVTVPASRIVTVNMFLKPLNVIITNKQQQLSAGRTYEIECQAIGSVPAAKITWWKNDQLMTNVSRVISSDKNVSSSILTFTPSMHDHNATLKCVATNPNVETWSEETTRILDISYVPVVHLTLGPELNPNDIEEEDDVYFNCKIKANPPVYKIIWKHNDVYIHQNLKNEILVNDKSLVLRKVKKESIGNYTCVASNVEGDTESNSVELRVSYKPVCKPNQKLVYGAGRNEDIQVVCEVDANPEPESFKWSFNHSQEPIPEKKYSVVDKRRGISILTFTPISEMDFGYLTCAASNRVGKQLSPCIFQVIPAITPHAPHNCSIGNVTTVSLEVHCKEGFDGGLAQQFLLEVINFTTGNVMQNVTSTEPYFKLNTLSPGNSVQVKVYSINAKGRSQAFVLEGSTLKAEKHTGLPGTLEITPLLGVIICVSVFVVLFVLLIVFLAKCTSSSLRKSSHRPTTLCIKEKTTHASLLENQERDEKDPDLIPVQKSTGYQVLRTDAGLDENIKSSRLSPNSSSHHAHDHNLISDDEQLNFIDCTEKLQPQSASKVGGLFNNGENT